MRINSLICLPYMSPLSPMTSPPHTCVTARETHASQRERHMRYSARDTCLSRSTGGWPLYVCLICLPYTMTPPPHTCVTARETHASQRERHMRYSARDTCLSRSTGGWPLHRQRSGAKHRASTHPRVGCAHQYWAPAPPCPASASTLGVFWQAL